jgi:fermentation-respiration switch protein FrsA (DUF1100 family)
VLNYYRKQLVSFLTAMLVVVGQFVTVVHATDHPYHAHDDSCTIYQATEKHKLTHVPEGLHFEVVLTGEDRATVAASNHSSILTSTYLARAPPYQS